MDFERQTDEFFNILGTLHSQDDIYYYLVKCACLYGTRNICTTILDYIIPHAKHTGMYTKWNKGSEPASPLVACREFFGQYKNKDAEHNPCFDMIQQYFENGFTIQAKYDTGATVNRPPFATLAEVLEYRKTAPYITRYACTPADKGFLVIDADYHDKTDGKELFTMWKAATGFSGILSTPVFVDTPNRGRHYYFRTNLSRETKFIQYPCDYNEVELKAGNNNPAHSIGGGNWGINLTIAGSTKNVKADGRICKMPYILHGNLADAPLLPDGIVENLFVKKEPTQKKIYSKRRQTVINKPTNIEALYKIYKNGKDGRGGHIYGDGANASFLNGFIYLCCIRKIPMDITKEFILNSGKCEAHTNREHKDKTEPAIEYTYKKNGGVL